MMPERLQMSTHDQSCVLVPVRTVAPGARGDGSSSSDPSHDPR